MPPLPIMMVPWLIVVAPVYVFVPLRVRVPPATVRAVLAPVMVPLKEPPPVTVKVAAVPLSVTVPVPLRLPTVWLKPARSSVPGDVTVNAVSVGRALAMPSASVPAEIVVGPL